MSNPLVGMGFPPPYLASFLPSKMQENRYQNYYLFIFFAPIFKHNECHYSVLFEQLMPLGTTPTSTFTIVSHISPNELDDIEVLPFALTSLFFLSPTSSIHILIFS